MRGCLQLKAALTRLNTNLVSQRGALAALRDERLPPARRGGHPRQPRPPRARRSPASTASTLAVAPQRGLACAVELDDAGPTAQELMVALFARRVAVYPGDGLGERARRDDAAPQPVAARPWAMEHLRAVLGEAIDEAASGRWREPVAELLEGKGTERARRAGRARAAGPMTSAELMAEHGSPLWLVDLDRVRARLRELPRRVGRRPGPTSRSPTPTRPTACRRSCARWRRGRGPRGRVRGRVRAGARRRRRGAGPTSWSTARPSPTRCSSAPRATARSSSSTPRPSSSARPRAGVRRVGLRVALPGVGRRADALRHRARRRSRAAARARRALGLERRGAQRPPRLHRLRPAARGAPRLGAAITVQWPPAPDRHAARPSAWAAWRSSSASATVDLGGGFPAAPAVAAHAAAVAAALRTAASRGRLMLEPGRALVADAVDLACTVVAVKALDGRHALRRRRRGDQPAARRAVGWPAIEAVGARRAPARRRSSAGRCA